ncbi:erythromycin esterase family protein [Hymenobacter cellulosivorans]|uniref:Erythromycin esterase family protein n=1 Tax=Hymenobacter cellulosivorans TaxID=2932249 RepID=A0ABY4FBU6_9BACT|nr:erythromycin esterase family protein [Hymenobacter cellulosivorans]UOQ53462.1 erythromycin esterase family protein [Hymenobacter cellulosivorans]
MFSIRRLLGICLLWLVLALAVQAQPTLPARPVRSISPADTSFADLEFLVQEIGRAQVVMLGEPTHGEGNVTEAKIRLIRFLQQRLGFTTVAFESGFYELDKAQREISTGVPVREAIEASVFNVWTGTQEFQALLPLLGKGRLRVAGFDSQLSGAYQESQLEELEALLKPEKGGNELAYDYLEECLSTMGENFLFPPTHQILIFDLQIGKARKLLEKVAAGTDAQRRERAVFWLQNLRSLQALAHDYATNDPAARDSSEWTATTSNPRDAQMADNLLWYVRQHPREKVICWGALGHLANKVHVLSGDDVKEFRSMGQAVKAKLGPDAVYVLGTLAGGGSHGFGSWGKPVAVPTPAAGTLEAQLLAKSEEYSFVSLKHDAPGQMLTTYAFEYKPMTGRWSEVVDGFLFLKSVNPPHAATVSAATAAATPDLSGSAPSPARRGLNPATRPAGKTGPAILLTGTVLDHKTGGPVPFATVAVPSRSTGTISDAQGRFRLPSRQGETVQVSSIGYEPVMLTARSSSAPLAVQLVPAAFALADVRVSAQSQDPHRIMKKVIKAAATNYEQQNYAAQVYSHRRITNFDTLRYEVEYVSDVLDPAGFKEWHGGFLMMGPKQTHLVREKHALVPAQEPADYSVYLEPGHGFFTAGSDPVRISPLFKSGTLGKYQLRFDSIEQRSGETLYVIRFAVKRATNRSTGMYLVSGYAGKVYVRQRDYAVVRYEALWQEDTVKNNAIARKYHGTKSDIARLYPEVFSDHRKAHVVTYEQGANGRYHVASSVAQVVSIGHILGGKPFYAQKFCEEYFTPLPQPTPADLLAGQDDPTLRRGEIWQASKTPYRPLFWQSYQRPQPTEPAPQLEVSKP